MAKIKWDETGEKIYETGVKNGVLYLPNENGEYVKGNEYGYKLHLIYGAKASPSEKSYSTINDSPEAITFSYEITTTPVNVTGHKPTASLTINSTKVEANKLQQLEAMLYGAESTEAKLPLPDEVINLLKNNG